MKHISAWLITCLFFLLCSTRALSQYQGDAWLQILGADEVRETMGRQIVYLGVTNTIEPGSIFIRNRNTIALSFRFKTAFPETGQYIVQGNQTTEHGSTNSER